MKIVSAFMWSYEREAATLHVETLRDDVDAFVAVQANTTFQGKKRDCEPLAIPGVVDVVISLPPNRDAWECEKWLRNKVLIEAHKIHGDDAIYIISDGDEIPHPEAIRRAVEAGKPMRLMTDYRNFYADWRAIDHVLEHQPTIGTYKQYEAVGGAGDARWHANWDRSTISGWHLSSLGDTSEIKLKTFAHTEYNKPEYIQGIDKAKSNGRDFLNRFDLEHTNDVPPGVPKHLLGGKL